MALAAVGLQQLAPMPQDVELHRWWRTAGKRQPRELRKGFNTMVILVLWSLWTQRNRCVFNGAAPSASTICREIAEQATLW